MRPDDILHVISAVKQAAGRRFRFAVNDVIALYAANARHAGENARAVRIAQAALDVIVVELTGVNMIVSLHLLKQLR